MLLGLFYIEEIEKNDLYAVFPIKQFSTNKIQLVSTIMLSRLSLKGESSENKKKEQKKKTKKRKRLKNEDVEEEEFSEEAIRQKVKEYNVHLDQVSKLVKI